MKNSSSESQQLTTNTQIVSEDEIDLIELAKVIWSRKWFITKVTGVFLVLGLIIAFTSPKEYKTSSTLIPEMTGQVGKLEGSLGGLASLAGVDLGSLSGSSNQIINPALYQSVSQSTPFLLELMKQEYYFKEIGEELSIYNYYLNHFKTSLFAKALSLPGRLISWIKGDIKGSENLFISEDSASLKLTGYQQKIAENLRSRVFVEMDWELNLVTIEVEMQDPEVAAMMATFTREYITEYVTSYAISKSQQQLELLERQYQERKEGFEKVQFQLAAFRDKNQNAYTALARSEEERLQSEYNLSFNIYNQLAQQREAVKLQIQENTPVFTVLEPVKIPLHKSKPKNRIFIFASFFLGIICGVGIIVVTNLFRNY